jgi:hypothetical protein
MQIGRGGGGVNTRETKQLPLVNTIFSENLFLDTGCTMCALSEAEPAKAAFKKALKQDSNHTEVNFSARQGCSPKGI